MVDLRSRSAASVTTIGRHAPLRLLASLGWMTLGGACGPGALLVDQPDAGPPTPSGPPEVPCALAADDPARETLETRCDGIDNDCDGLVDVLLPTGPNVCTGAAPNACGRGTAYCVGSERVCAVPAAAPEVKNGLDDDCNGIVDDVPPFAARSRLLVLIPDYLWGDAANEIEDVTAIVDRWGIPFDVSPEGSFAASAAAAAGDYAVVFVPGYLQGGIVDAPLCASLEAFAASGGVVVITKPVDDAASGEMHGLLGITQSTRHFDASSIVIDGASATAVRAFDSPEEQRLPIGGEEVYTFVPASGTSTVAEALAGESSLGPAIVRRSVGQGAVYAIGHDLHAFAATRCYVNCFEPFGDLLALFLRDALREGTRGHLVLKHPSAEARTSTVMITHDVDAPDAHNEGTWGAPGALQLADVERSFGAVGTFFVTTDFVSGYYNADTVRGICERGMCPLAAHSVRHADMTQMPPGPCELDQAIYPHVPPVVHCEITLSKAILEELSGGPVRVWRSPYLYVADSLFDQLHAEGFLADSSFGIGDLRSNLPVSLARGSTLQELFHHRPLYSLPITAEDGKGDIVDGVETREELQTKNRSWFVTQWTYAALRNAANLGHTVVLVHPSYGVGGVGPDNLANKVEATRQFLAGIAEAELPVRNVDEVAAFWRGREQIALDAHYDPATGYAGTITTGTAAAPGFTLEFGDDLTSFECAGCGEIRVVNNRVVLASPPTSSTLTFVAKP